MSHVPCFPYFASPPENGKVWNGYGKSVKRWKSVSMEANAAVTGTGFSV